jgi:hypothetical protein
MRVHIGNVDLKDYQYLSIANKCFPKPTFDSSTPLWTVIESNNLLFCSPAKLPRFREKCPSGYMALQALMRWAKQNRVFSSKPRSLRCLLS